MVEQLDELKPDLITMQEVRLKGNSSNAHWLADNLNQLSEETEKNQPYQVYLCPKTGVESKREAIAILSRFPVKNHECLDLLSQNRVAQLLRFRVNDLYLLLVNVHLYWEPGVSKSRQKQIELVLDFLDTQPVELPVIICGDFNGVPGTPSIELVRQYFDSAHNFVNRKEPDYTCPTPLPKSRHVRLRSLILWLSGLGPNPNSSWNGTLDYIFVDPRLQTQDCQVVLNQSADDSPDIYPSDHFGLWATIKVTE